MFIHRRAVLLLVLLTTLSSAGAEPPQAVPEPRLTIVTASSHCDWTWGHTRAWHAERYAQIIRNVLLLMRRHPHYVWQLETENEELAPFLEQARQKWPELIDEFWQRVREGRIEVIGAISAPRLCEVYPETMVRNLVLGKQYFRAGAPGVPQPVYHAVDVMVGHSQMPQLLTQAEYRCFVFSRPSQQKQVFWRTGLDGTRMLSVLQHYGFGGVQAGGIALESHSGDDILPSEDLVKAAATWDSNRKVLATSARFFEEVERTGCKLPELKGPLDSLESFCCGTGLHGNRNLYTWNNQNEDLLLAVERAQVMASALGGRSSPSTRMRCGTTCCPAWATRFCGAGRPTTTNVWKRRSRRDRRARKPSKKRWRTWHRGFNSERSWARRWSCSTFTPGRSRGLSKWRWKASSSNCRCGTTAAAMWGGSWSRTVPASTAAWLLSPNTFPLADTRRFIYSRRTAIKAAGTLRLPL
ncbi:MAG TPA: hypothetical protein PLF81_00155 [Candidatus Anammoximicrobium sp.]|nr:hypothetical protein [Candidatus Anammoximicrobium sp.]